MRRWRTAIFGVAMLSVGYLLGTAELFGPAHALAQQDNSLSEDSANRVRAAYRALQDAMEQLRSEGKYTALSDELNVFLILSGGGNAQQDLDEGNGVDPETFAALYAGRALPEVAERLGVDDEGRITYNDKPVQMYSRRRLSRMFAERAAIQDY